MCAKFAKSGKKLPFKDTGEAFGFTCLGGDMGNAELGYVSIPEIVATNRLELDLYWNDEKTLKDVMHS